MKNILLGVIILCVIQNVFAQTNDLKSDSVKTYMMNMREGIMGTEYINPVVSYKGNQYYNNWAYGEILLTDGVRINGLRLRYDQYLDQLLWLSDDFFTWVLCKTCIKGFNLYDDSNNIVASFIKKKVKLPLDNNSYDCLLQVLVEGENSFYAFRKVSRLQNALKLEDDTKYYIFNNDQFEKVRLRTHDLLNVSFIDEKKMKSIIKSNKIRARDNEQEFIRAISLYNK